MGETELCMGCCTCALTHAWLVYPIPTVLAWWLENTDNKYEINQTNTLKFPGIHQNSTQLLEKSL